MRNILSHVPAILLAAFMVFMGMQKFGAENMVFATIAERSGISLFEPGIRMLTGVLELLAALLLVVPGLRALGSILSLGLIGGAILFHLSPWLGISVVLEPGAAPTPQLFIMAVVSFIVTLFVAFQYRGSIPFIGHKVGAAAS